jgi:hypothetical protein
MDDLGGSSTRKIPEEINRLPCQLKSWITDSSTHFAEFYAVPFGGLFETKSVSSVRDRRDFLSS